MAAGRENSASERPILLVPYVWIGDFVRCHSVVRLIRERWPKRPVDVLTSTLCAPLLDYMPGVRKGIVFDIPRRRPALAENWRLAQRLKQERYGTALVMSRKWKAALAPYLAGIPERVGFVGEGRFGLLSDVRWGEQKLPRMVDSCAVLALPRDAAQPPSWPEPQLKVPKQAAADWRAQAALARDKRPIVALCPGAVGKGKRWPEGRYAELARKLAADGISVWVLGGPGEKAIAATISGNGKFARDLTSDDLRNAILALASADAAVSNDSGLLHVAAAIGTPAIGLFGPTSRWHVGPLNPVAAIIEAPWRGAEGDISARSTEDIPVEEVFQGMRRVLKRA